MSGSDLGSMLDTLGPVAARQAQTARVARVVVAAGLDHVTDPDARRVMAYDVAQALGLIPTVPACPARKHGDGTAGNRNRTPSAPSARIESAPATEETR